MHLLSGVACQAGIFRFIMMLIPLSGQGQLSFLKRESKDIHNLLPCGTPARTLKLTSEAM